MKKFLLVLVSLIFLLVVIFAGVVAFVDVNRFKPEIEKLALKYANLTVKINGDIKIGYSLKPSLELSDVEISNPETKAEISQIGNALVQFSIIPLLKKEIMVDTIQTVNTKIIYGKEAKDNVLIKDFVAGMDSFSSPISVSFDTVVSGLSISGEGTVSSLKDIQKSDFNSINTDIKVKALGYTLHYKGDVTGLQSKIVAEGDYDVEYKNNIINGKINANLTGKLPNIKLNAKSNVINLADFTSSPKTASNWLISSAFASELVPNIQIPYSYLTFADVDADIEIKTLKVMPQLTLSDIASSIQLKNSDLNLKIKNITIGDGKVDGQANLNAKNKTASVNISGTDIIIQKAYKDFSKENKSELYIKDGGKSQILLNINTSGADTNQYLANLNGQIIAIADKSTMKIKSLEKLQGNIIVQILQNLKLNITDNDLSLKCAVVRGDVKNGLINFPKGIVFDANNFYLVANGTSNLQNDKLDFELQPFSGKITDANISSILGNLLKIKGTFSNPKLGLNQTEAVKSVVGALASGGLYNAGDMMLSADSSPCFTALSGTSFSSYFKNENTVKSNVSNTYVDTKEAVKNIGNQAKDLLKGLLKEKEK